MDVGDDSRRSRGTLEVVGSPAQSASGREDLKSIVDPATAKADRECFVRAHRAWDLDTQPSKEAAMLRAALPVLRRLENALSKNDATGPERRALHQVLDAIEDGLDGYGWASLTIGKAGQGFNLAQRRALAFGFAYIAAARAGKVLDPDPVRTVCEVYARRGKPLSPDSLSRWRRKYDLDTSQYDSLFIGDPKEVTARAKEDLRRNSKLVREGPSQTKR